MKSRIFLVFLLMAPFVSNCQTEEGDIDYTKRYYVLAPSGLNLREDANAGSEKLTTIPYGTQLELIALPGERNMLIDQIPGGMVQVRYEELIGYTFSGFLSRFPAPEMEMVVADFVENMRMAGHETLSEEIVRDWGGYIQSETAFHLKGKNWPEAYLIAQRLFKIPSALLFPQHSDEREVILENPDKGEDSWSDELTTLRQENGELKLISYGFRTEALGYSVTITYSEDEGGLRISKLSIAD